MDGLPWPVQDEETLWLPAGPHAVEPVPAARSLRLVYLNANLKSARIESPATIEFTYTSSARAIAILSRPPGKLQIDGADATLTPAGSASLLLPRGQHLVTVTAQ